VELNLLPPILLALAEQQSLDAVLSTIVNAVAAQPDVALARVWLRDNDRSCPVCADGDARTDQALHLRASAGDPLDASADWSRVSGSFHRVALTSSLKLAHIARTGKPVRINRLSEDSRWIKFPEWVERERLVGFAGRPLIFRGEVLGVLGAFRRVELSDACWSWLQALSDAAAVAVANARAFEEADALRRALELERDYLREELQESGAFGDILGRSAALTRVLRDVDTVAATETNVLILGESGTGKELIARAIHQRSRRAGRPLVKVNCGSIPRELFESEFFGHVRGSFTGAIRDRIGRFQLADGGTLFLDEVGEIPLDLQVKLLRVLQEGEFERVGDDATRRVNVRVVAATNRDLQQEVAAQRFRLDLFYRLGVFPISVPPLRARREDIPDLIAHFVRQSCARLHIDVPKLPLREIERARAYDWPGNVRELQNVVERAVILSRDGVLRPVLPEWQPSGEPSPIGGKMLEDVQREYILQVLQDTRWVIGGPDGVAARLELKRTTLLSKMARLGLARRPR
jgi:transcriptional regulator with GAF, ATPase, and Fis domain